MEVRFWGTRGSIPKPGPGTLRYGGNTACVELRTAAGTRIVIDCGSGAQDLGQALMATGQRPVSGHLLISHTHWDHIQGLPFFAPLFVPGNEWDIYGPHAFCHSLREALAGQMQYTYFPVALQQFGATTRYHDLVEGVFQVAEVSIRTQYLNHPALTLGYRLEVDGLTIVYACDHEPYARQLAGGSGEITGQDRDHADFLAGADLVIHDGQYTAGEYPAKVGWGHSTVEYVVNLCRSADVRRLAITHHDPLRSDAALDRIIENVRTDRHPLEIFAAAEGQVVELAPQPRAASASPSRRSPARPDLPPAIKDQLVLVVASDPTIVQSVRDAVHAGQVRVLEAQDGSSATRILKNERVSLVVVDHRPPAFGGVDVCRTIRSQGGRFAEMPIVLVASEQDASLSADAGVTDWLVKPFSAVYARTKMHAWLMRTACRWMRAPVPQNEEQRLAALRRLEILDTGAEERFDRIVRLAAALFDVPIALVSLVDRERQWYKSHHGQDVQETSRELSFCAHAILDQNVMMVPDTLLDPRFADNPLVVGEPRIRFYAGHPLLLEDEIRVGTLCLVDTRPRRLDKTQIGLLRDLGQLVEQELRASPRAAPGLVPAGS